MKLDLVRCFSGLSIVASCLFWGSVKAQVTPDGTTSTTVIPTEAGVRIENGDRAGGNLFHSFDDFSVDVGTEAFFANPNDIVNIFSRVTGGNISNIDGMLRANGTANLFLINPAGILFGEGASLQLGGSFYGTTADSIVFPDGEFSATNLDNPPLITINAPIGLNFRDNPGEIINQSIVSDEEDFPIGLEVAEDKTLALIGGDIFIDGGLITTPGGRIELSSVGENSTVTITEGDFGLDFSYEGVTNFRDITLSFEAVVETLGIDTGDIKLQGRNISLIEGSEIAIETELGSAGNISVFATESLSLDGFVFEEETDDVFPTTIRSDIILDGTGEGSEISIETPQLFVTDGASISATNLSDDPDSLGTNIAINTAEIEVSKESGISAAVDFDEELGDGEGDGGNITIDTNRLTLSEGGQIDTGTFSQGDAGDLTINASESVNLIGTVPDTDIPSALFADVGQDPNATGNSGNLTLTTKTLSLRDGAQISSSALNEGNGGNVTINASESILVSGFADSAEARGGGRSSILVGVEPLIFDVDDNPVRTTGSGGTLDISSPEITVENGGQITANTFSLGDGGDIVLNSDRINVSQGGEISAGSLLEGDSLPGDDERGDGGSLTINATESVIITGATEINGETINSSIFTEAESTGDAGSIDLTTDELSISDGGSIGTNATGTGSANDLKITATNIVLDRGEITAATAAGDRGNITLEVAENIFLDNQSRITAQAFNNANAGNIEIDTEFIVAIPDRNSDILASSQSGEGGQINISAEALFGIEERVQNDITNDIDATSAEGNVDGVVNIETPEVDPLRTNIDLPDRVVASDTIVSQGCNYSAGNEGQSSFVVLGKGGVPPEPTEPLNLDIINVEPIDTSDRGLSQLAPTPARSAKFIPARGIIVKEDGSFVLTAYPTPGTPGYRAYRQKIGCYYQ